MKQDFIQIVFSKPQTVFTFAELSLIFPEVPYPDLKSKVHYFVRNHKLDSPRKGIYTKEAYDPLELANKLYSPSYISFETVLQKVGIVFQVYTTIFVASYLSRRITVSDQEIYYQKMQAEVLVNTLGIEQKEEYAIASKERAFLDAVFRYRNYYFDNLRPLDWDKVFDFTKIYSNKAFVGRVDTYYKMYKEEYV